MENEKNLKDVRSFVRSPARPFISVFKRERLFSPRIFFSSAFHVSPGLPSFLMLLWTLRRGRRGDAVCWYFVVYVIWYFIFAANKDNSINNIVIYDVWISGDSKQSTKGICNLKLILKYLFEWTGRRILISIFKREIIICRVGEGKTSKRQARWWKFLCEASTFNQILWATAWCLRGEYFSLPLTICPPGVESSSGRNNTVSVKKNKTAMMFLWAKVKSLWIEG